MQVSGRGYTQRVTMETGTVKLPKALTNTTDDDAGFVDTSKIYLLWVTQTSVGPLNRTVTGSHSMPSTHFRFRCTSNDGI